MTLTGIDIVDLTCPLNQAGFNNKEYLKKFLTDDELRHIQKHNSLYMPAVFWTCKESAYKILLKMGFQKAFSPAKFNVKIIDRSENIIHSEINYKNQIFHSLTTIKSVYIVTIAGNEKSSISESLLNEIIIESKNKEVADMAFIDHFSKKHDQPEKKFKIVRRNSDPSIFFNNEKFSVDLSISHDRQFHAYTFIKV
ncbi:MAG: 4'-phosphopantetheinyl transferase superfamily protein [Bacteroidota bacterium]